MKEERNGFFTLRLQGCWKALLFFVSKLQSYHNLAARQKVQRVIIEITEPKEQAEVFCKMCCTLVNCTIKSKISGQRFGPFSPEITTAGAIERALISTLPHSWSHAATVKEGKERGRKGTRWTEMARMCHLSSFSHVSEIGVTNGRVPFVSRRIVTGFLSGLATLIRGVEQAGWVRATLKLEGSMVQWHIHQCTVRHVLRTHSNTHTHAGTLHTLS